MIKKAIGWIIAATLVLTILSLAILKLPAVQAKIHSIITQKIYEATGLTIEAKIDWITLPFSVELVDVTIREREDLVATAASLKMKAYPLSLLFGKVLIPDFSAQAITIYGSHPLNIRGALSFDLGKQKAKVKLEELTTATFLQLHYKKSEEEITVKVDLEKPGDQTATLEIEAPLSEWDQIAQGEGHIEGILIAKGIVNLKSRVIIEKAGRSIVFDEGVAQYGEVSARGRLLLLDGVWQEETLIKVSRGALSGNIQLSGPLLQPAYALTLGDFKGHGTLSLDAITLEGNGKNLEVENFTFDNLSCKMELTGLFGNELQGFLEIDAKALSFEEFKVVAPSLKIEKLPEKKRWDIRVSSSLSRFSGDALWDQERRQLFLDVKQGALKSERYTLALKQPTTIIFAEENLFAKELHLSINSGTLEGNMSYSGGRLSLEAEAAMLPARLLETLFHLPIDDGFLSGAAKISGKAEKLQGTLKLEGENLQFSEALPYQNQSLRGTLEATAKGDLLELKVALQDANEAPFIDINADIPLTVMLRAPIVALNQESPFTLNAKAKAPIGPLLDLLAANSSSIKGHVEMDLQGHGTLKDPKMDGTVKMSDGIYENYELGTVVKDFSATLSASGNTLQITTITGSDDGSGRLVGSGFWSLDQTRKRPYSLEVHLEEFLFAQLDALAYRGSGTLRLIGDDTGAKLEGELSSSRTVITIPDSSTSTLDNVDITYINQSRDEKPPTPREPILKKSYPINLDLKVAIPSNLTIVSDELSSNWKGDLAIGGQLEKPLVKGLFTLLQGRYLLNGKAFELKEGTITFDGDLKDETTLYVVATREIQNYYVDIILKGHLSDPDILLRSTPPLPQQGVLSLVLFGQEPSDISQSQDLVLEKSLSSLQEYSQNEAGAFSKLQKSLFIDTIDIKREGGSDDELRLQVGKYLTPNVFISVNKSINEEGSRVAAEIKLHKEIRLQLEADDQAAGQISLKWRRDY